MVFWPACHDSAGQMAITIVWLYEVVESRFHFPLCQCPIQKCHRECAFSAGELHVLAMWQVIEVLINKVTLTAICFIFPSQDTDSLDAESIASLGDEQRV